jgi:hypothetical protein
MAMTTIPVAANGRCETILDGLKAEFGAIVAARILEAEAMDFLWDARVAERYLGQHFEVGGDGDDDDTELLRVAITSFLAGHWYAAICVADGEGRAVELLSKQQCDGPEEARTALDWAR